MFGGFGNTQSNTGGFGGFGATNQTQQPQQQQQQQQQQPATGGGLFGGFGAAPAAGNTQQNPSGPSLFGNTSGTQNTGGGLFGGNAVPSGGLFGNTNTNTAQQPATGGLFGNANTQQTQPATGGGLFGTNTNTTNTTTAPTGGLFGTAPAQQNATGGGLFGNQTTNAQGATAGGGLFGNTSNPATNTGGGLFGNTANNAAPGAQSAQTSLFGSTQQKPAGSLFGQPAQQPAQGSLFGQTTTQPQMPNSLFGGLSQQPSAPSGNLLGSSTLGISSFGAPTLGSSLLPARGTVVPMQNQQDPQAQFQAVVQRIEGVKQAWDPNSPQCRFQHYFYNLVDPAQVHLYGRPVNAANDALWQKAVRDNPDPSCMVPVLAVGFDDLQQRVDAQTKQAAEHQEKLKELKTRLEALSQRHQVTNTSRLRRAQALQTQLTHRVLRVVQHLHLLIPALRSSSIRPEEEALRAALEEIDEDVRRPGGMGKMRGKLNEMWALVDAVRAARGRDRQEGAVEWAVVDEEGLARITQVLAEEQAGLAHVTNLLQQDLKALAVILGVPAKEEEPDALSGSATALRSSLIH
ncbi:hypothetical protein PHLGIDRAFT_25400 [Phlebiopsis gigantea 11061_1 CR5-6]|uniref:Nucleoporin Nup54 alpha-helical domain-containing protein n=1 Tax=Phlebiopsis gigantea (strain 11061_1 CR5-6) TaxID=745531 RepID=A0A0C3RUS5_PHLG1|nr:hypothetical protein PHLGIDRAFT_25400 [Phlebiopsis gigantea 11061_1 CR5-6]